ncbi:fibronectin type III domain-containing protein [Motilimonas pumila]|uniref:Fibronectin type-III domain-containing protein n=1 Tax=Motilimonas pumila TaxID=2303987 RepID=A0A418Y9F4_9GAMM|nr:fibronectin type III domain-containing protein [Motilimonas pumila]RJG37347.1 hypothetical protein D1Z90_19825 [Motilimonas pumila]
MAAASLFAFVPINPANAEVLLYQYQGQWLEGETITLSGNGFGERSPSSGASTATEVAPYRFETVESGLVDEQGLLNSFASVVTDNNRPGSQFNLLHQRGEAITYTPITTRWGHQRHHEVRYSLSVEVKDKTPVHQYFASAWVRLSDDFLNMQASRYNQTALISFQPDRAGTSGLVGGGGIGVSAVKNPAELSVSTSSGELTRYHGSIIEKMTPGTWHRIDAWVSVNDDTTHYQDEVSFWLDGQLVASRQQAGFRQTEFPAMLGVHFVSYMKNLNTGEQPWSVQTDDHYVDFTQARIELGNAPTFAESNHREIQPSSSWQSDQVSFTFNQGSFQPGEQVYLYLVDQNGEVNREGLPVRLPGGTDPNPDNGDVFAANINFQPANAEVPLDYIADTGLEFGDRGNGYHYGWSSDISTSTRDRNNVKAADQRYDTLAHMLLPSKGFDASWEIALPNGDYRVRLVAGDPTYKNGLQEIDVEGVPFISVKADSSGSSEHTGTVTVADGHLTISSRLGTEVVANKLQFVEIASATGEPDSAPPSSSYQAKVAADDGQVFLEWQNPLFDFTGALVVYSTSPITTLPTAGTDYRSLNELGDAVVHSSGPATQAMIAGLDNGQQYYIAVFAYDDAFNYAPAVTTQVVPEVAPNREIAKQRALKAMEQLTTGNTPDLVYDTHNRFASLFFGAESIPEVYQLYGDTLTVESGSQWQHESETSFALAWQTNLPALTYVEYGQDTSYGQQTDIAERPFYTHNHYLTGLTPDTQYHYRLVSTDERGTVHYSPDMTFTTRSPENVIRIPDDMTGSLPWTLDQSDVTYLITEDITAESGIFKVTGENIVLDLGGHTLTHADKLHTAYNGKDPNNNGMAIWRLNYPLTAGKLKIVNGIIRQGSAANIGGNYGGYNAIHTSNTDDLEIAGITFDYHTAQTYALYMSFSPSYPYQDAEYYIHHNTFKDRGWHIVNRHGKTGGRSLLFTGTPPADRSNFKLHYNLVKRTRQNGLSGSASVLHNEVYVDSWATNAFAIQPYSAPGKNAGEVRHNRMFLTGYHAIGATWAHESLNVADNLIHMESINSGKNRWWESFGDQNSLNGLRITNYGKGGQVRNNLVYSRNTIVGTARNGALMRGTEFFSDYSIKGTILEDSTIRLEAEDSITDRVSPVVTQGTSNLDHEITLYRNSTLSSNITNVRFGDSYGRGYNHHFHNVHFEKLGDNPHYHTFIFDGAYSRDGHVIRDATFSGGAAWDDVYWKATGDLSAYSVQWTLTLSGQPNAQVGIQNVNGETVFSGYFDVSGKLQVPLTQATIRPLQWTPASTGSGVRDKFQHQKIFATPHTVTVTTADGSRQEQQVNMDGQKALVF